MHAILLACMLVVCSASTTYPAPSDSIHCVGSGMRSRSDSVVGRARGCPLFSSFQVFKNKGSGRAPWQLPLCPCPMHVTLDHTGAGVDFGTHHYDKPAASRDAPPCCNWSSRGASARQRAVCRLRDQSAPLCRRVGGGKLHASSESLARERSRTTSSTLAPRRHVVKSLAKQGVLITRTRAALSHCGNLSFSPLPRVRAVGGVS